MKKLLAVLLAVMMLAALTVPALAAEPAVIEEEPVVVEEPAADGAAHAHDGVTFRNSLLAGTFYLTKNIDLSEVVGVPQDMTVPANMTLQLCLNGYELTADLDMVVRAP